MKQVKRRAVLCVVFCFSGTCAWSSELSVRADDFCRYSRDRFTVSTNAKHNTDGTIVIDFLNREFSFKTPTGKGIVPVARVSGAQFTASQTDKAVGTLEIRLHGISSPLGQIKVTNVTRRCWREFVVASVSHLEVSHLSFAQGQ